MLQANLHGYKETNMYKGINKDSNSPLHANNYTDIIAKYSGPTTLDKYILSKTLGECLFYSVHHRQFPNNFAIN